MGNLIEQWNNIKQGDSKLINTFIFIYKVDTKQKVKDCTTIEEFKEFCKAAPKGTYRLVRYGCSPEFDNKVFPKVEIVVE